MKRIHKRFQGLYWRQLFVTAGMVMLTLFLLGTSFFSLSYNYARSQQSDAFGPGGDHEPVIRGLSGERPVSEY